MEFLTRNPSKHRHVSLFARQKHADYVSWRFTRARGRIRRRCQRKEEESPSTKDLKTLKLQWFCLMFTLKTARWGNCASSSWSSFVSWGPHLSPCISVFVMWHEQFSRSLHNGLENLLLKKVVEEVGARNIYQSIVMQQKASFLFIKHMLLGTLLALLS